MNIAEAINLLEVIKFCDVDELAKIKAIDTAIISLNVFEHILNYMLNDEKLREIFLLKVNEELVKIKSIT